MRSFPFRNLVPRLKRISLFLVALLLVYTAGGFFLLPALLKPFLVEKLAAALNRQVSLERLAFNPLTFLVTLQGLRIADRSAAAAPLLAVDEILVNIEAMSAVKRALIIKEFTITRPACHLVRYGAQRFNFTDLLDDVGEKDAAGAGPFFYVGNIRLVDGRIDFDDQPVNKQHQVTGLLLSLPFIANMTHLVDTAIEPQFVATVDGAPLNLAGRTKPFHDSLETEFDLRLDDIDLSHYQAYLPFATDFTIRAGRLDIGATLGFRQHRDSQPSLILAGHVVCKQLEVADRRAKPFLQFSKFGLELAPSDLFGRKLHLRKVVCADPVLELHRDAAGVLNIAALLPASATTSDAPPPAPPDGAAARPQAMPLVTMDSFSLTNGLFAFIDEAEGQAFETRLKPFTFRLEEFTTKGEGNVRYFLEFNTETEEHLELQGSGRLFPLAVEGRLAMQSFFLPKYAPYFQKLLPVALTDATLNVAGDFSYLAGPEPNFDVTGLHAELTGLKLKEKAGKEELLDIPSISVDNTSLHLATREVIVGDLATRGGSMRLSRLKNGAFNLAALVPADEGADGKPAKAAGPPWQVTLDSLNLADYRVVFRDLALAEPQTFDLDNLAVKASGLTTREKAKAKVDFSMGLVKKGQLSGQGEISLKPLGADLGIALNKLPLPKFQPYLDSLARIKLASGALQTKGRLRVATTDAAVPPKLTYKGEAALVDLAASDLNGDEFCHWKSLTVQGLEVATSPTVLRIDTLGLTDYFAKIILRSTGTINLRELGPPAAATATEAEAKPATATPANPANPASPPPAVRIGQLTLQGGIIEFIDESVTPRFTSKMLETGGRISGLSSEADTTAEVDLIGRLNNHAPLEITGQINPLATELFVDLKVSLRDMDLSPLTPYSGRYVGYTIEKGKLFVDTKYVIKGNKIKAETSFFLDQFSFGEAVESEQALKLPVKMAIALLKDRKGEIHLDLPVSGDLDDPEFSIGPVIFKMIMNLIVKAVTSPFALLGAMFGGGEELSFVEFDYGSSLLTEATVAKLATLAKAMVDRPALKLEITGRADAEKDREALIQQRFDEKVKRQKREAMAKQDKNIDLAVVVVEPDEYENYLRKAYDLEDFPKPRNNLGLKKKLPVPEMEKLMLTHIEINNDDLRQLADERAQRIQDHLVATGQIEAERLFLLAPDVEAGAAGKDDRVLSRADFTIK